MMTGLFTSLKALLRHGGGNAAVEFAILLPILLLLVSATVDLGLGFQEKMRLQSAVNSGMQHVMQTQGNDIATTRSVIAYGLGADSLATVDVNAICRCSAVDLACNVPCATGRDRFVMAQISMPYRTAIFDMDMSLAASFEVYVGAMP